MSYSEANLKDQISNVIYLAEMQRQYGAVNTPNVITRTDAVISAMQQSDKASKDVVDGVKAFRSANAAMLTGGALKSACSALLLQLARVKNYPEVSPVEILRHLQYDYAQPTAVTINDRDFTFGAVAAGGSNVGSGTVYRLTVDPYDYPLQSTHAEVRTLICEQDVNGGSYAGQEVFTFYGQDRKPDKLLVGGSGIKGLAVPSRDGQLTSSFLQNPSFNGADTGTTFRGWTFGTMTNQAHDTDNYFRTYQGEGTAGSLKISSDGYLYQKLTTRRGVFQTDVPYLILLRWNRQVGSLNSGVDITIKLGSQTSHATVNATTETGWQTLVATMDKDLYYQNWRTTDAEVRVTISGITSGYLLLDDIVFVPMQMIDGLWYCPVGGGTPFVGGDRDSGDRFTFTDTVTGAVIAYWLWQWYGQKVNLPSNNAGGETWADPIAWA